MNPLEPEDLRTAENVGIFRKQNKAMPFLNLAFNSVLFVQLCVFIRMAYHHFLLLLITLSVESDERTIIFPLLKVLYK